MDILHLTAHVGGGVGKALSGLVAQASISNSSVRHRFICLEKPEKKQFIDYIRRYMGEVIVRPDINKLERLIRTADILQLEWWNHPATIECLCSLPPIPVRLLSWSHTSGLYNPIIPERLILASHKFLFTSHCSFEADGIRNLACEQKHRLGVVSSSGGFSGLPEVWGKNSDGISVGYLGSLNFAKLHPHYVDYLAAVDIPEFKVRMIGDLINKDILVMQSKSLGKAGIFDFRGYSADIASELSEINVLAYLLNPEHYGTTENALLEAMAMGIVPVVLDNPCERQIIDDYNTGLIVHSPGEFAEAMLWLHQNPEGRQRLGKQAAESVRDRFSVEKMEASLSLHYREVMSMEKKEILFSDIFGCDPAEWFLSCQGDKTIFTDDGKIFLNNEDTLKYGLLEDTKGTVFHFSRYFPDNLKLKQWAKNLTLLQHMKKNGDNTMNDVSWLSCPVCNSFDKTLLLNLNCGNMDGSSLYPTVRLVTCSQCGHAYNDLSPSEIEHLNEYYNNEYAPANLSSVVKDGDLPGSTGKMTHTRYNQLYRVLSPHIDHDGAILDIGCAVGGLLDFLWEKGFNKLYGVDVAEVYVEKARQKKKYVIERGSAESLPFDNDIFEAVIIEQVLEHLVNPAMAFREAKRVLKAGGVLCVGVPDAARYSDFYFYDYYWLLLREHIQHFDINSLKRIAQSEGFELLGYRQDSHSIMNEKMVMPNLCAVFRNISLRGDAVRNNHSNMLAQGLKKYVEREASRLSGKQTKLAELTKNQRPVYAWGVGREFLYLYEAAGLKHCNIAGVIDMNPFKQSSQKINQMKVSSPEILSNANRDSVLAITAIAHEESIKSCLINADYPCENISLS